MGIWTAACMGRKFGARVQAKTGVANPKGRGAGTRKATVGSPHVPATRAKTGIARPVATWIWGVVCDIGDFSQFGVAGQKSHLRASAYVA